MGDTKYLFLTKQTMTELIACHTCDYATVHMADLADRWETTSLLLELVGSHVVREPRDMNLCGPPDAESSSSLNGDLHSIQRFCPPLERA